MTIVAVVLLTLITGISFPRWRPFVREERGAATFQREATCGFIVLFLPLRIFLPLRETLREGVCALCAAPHQ